MLQRTTYFSALCLSATLLSCSPGGSDSIPGELDYYTAYATIERLNPEEPETGLRSAINPNYLIKILDSNRLSKRVAQRILAEKLNDELMAPYLGLSPPPTLEELIKNHRRMIELSDSSIIKVGYQHPNADMAAKVANLFAEELMHYNRTLNIGSSPVEDLTYRVEAQSEKLAELESKLVAYREQPEYNAIVRELEVQGKFYEALKQRLAEEQAKESANAKSGDGKLRIIERADAANAERSK